MAPRLLDAAAITLFGLFVVLFGRGAYLEVKAMLAERLIAHAFAAHVQDGAAHRPWSWADAHPVASLEVPRLGVRRYVLSGASGTSMAFAAGHVDGTAAPNTPGNCVLAGHRDTRFAFLEEMRPGDVLDLTTRDGTVSWVVEALGVVEDDRTDLLEADVVDRLTLMTCYPFDGVLRSSRRWVVWCRPADALPGNPTVRSRPIRRRA